MVGIDPTVFWYSRGEGLFLRIVMLSHSLVGNNQCSDTATPTSTSPTVPIGNSTTTTSLIANEYCGVHAYVYSLI